MGETCPDLRKNMRETPKVSGPGVQREIEPGSSLEQGEKGPYPSFGEGKAECIEKIMSIGKHKSVSKPLNPAQELEGKRGDDIPLVTGRGDF